MINQTVFRNVVRVSVKEGHRDASAVIRDGPGARFVYPNPLRAAVYSKVSE